MVRTQIYLTEEERAGLNAVARSTGRQPSKLIREAIDRFLALARVAQRDAILQDTAGLWRHRDDLPDFAAERRSWDRG